MIHVCVKLLGPAIDMVGFDTLHYELHPPASLGMLIELLVAKYPRLRANASYLRFAVNNEYAEEGKALENGDEVGVIPPVAGGAIDLVRLMREPILVDQLTSRVADPSCGGLVTFEGVVRAEGSPGNPLEALEYSAYEDMALRLMERIRDEARERFDVCEVAIVHRLGRLAVGECSVAIVVSAPHRAAAFDACRWIIEAIKKDVPIWKKDIWRTGETTWTQTVANDPD